MSFKKSAYSQQSSQPDITSPVSCKELLDFLQENKPQEIAIPALATDWFWITAVTYRAGFIVFKSSNVETHDIVTPQELVSILKRYPEGTPSILINDKIYLFKNYKTTKRVEGILKTITLYLGYPRTSLELSCSLDWLGSV